MKGERTTLVTILNAYHGTFLGVISVLWVFQTLFNQFLIPMEKQILVKEMYHSNEAGKL